MRCVLDFTANKKNKKDNVRLESLMARKGGGLLVFLRNDLNVCITYLWKEQG